MSELIDNNDNRATIRWKLLTGASALALAAYISSIPAARAEDASKPPIWIEFGGQVERQTGDGDIFAQPFITRNPDSAAFKPISPIHAQRAPLFANGGELALSFEPGHSNWVFSASMRYGRAVSSNKHAQTNPALGTPMHATLANGHTEIVTPHNTYAFDVLPRNVDSHLLLDFTAGKDVGLGMFGKSAESTFGIGVRYAEFSADANALMHARPKIGIRNQFANRPPKFFPAVIFYSYMATSHVERAFRGVGPSISWNASLPVAGAADDEELTIDWGVNAALLFGRQSAKIHHKTMGQGHGIQVPHTPYTNIATFDRTHSVTVPDAGGLIGMSLKFPNAKVSIGYRGDFFFGAMDTGNAARRNRMADLYGPFVSISFGLGD